MEQNRTSRIFIPFWFRPFLPVGIILLLACSMVGLFGRAAIGKAEAAQVSAANEAIELPAPTFPTPTPQTRYTICLDPGHGGEDPGSILTQGEQLLRREKDDNLRLALATKKELEKMGFRVILTQDDDSYLDTTERAQFANENDVDLLISLHRNMYAGPEEANGIEAWIAHNKPAEDYRLCRLLFQQFEKLGYMDLREIRTGTMMDPQDDYNVNGLTNMVSCILEMGFITSDRDNELFDAYYRDYAKAIAQGVETYFNG